MKSHPWKSGISCLDLVTQGLSCPVLGRPVMEECDTHYPVELCRACLALGSPAVEEEAQLPQPRRYSEFRHGRVGSGS